MKYTIGVDLGTSGVKLIALGSDGRIASSVTKEYPIYYPKPHYSEQDPEDWFKATVDGLSELLCSVDPSDVAALGIGGQMHGLVMLDENDRVLRPAILWNDTRSEEEVSFLNDVLSIDKLQSYTGNIAFAGFTAPKLMWVKKNEPDVFERCAKICLPKDYIVYRLTGVFGTDVSDASGTLYYDVENRRWSPEMLSVLSITENMLPKVYESFEPVGRTSVCGLNAVVCAGAGDNAAAAVGTNTVEQGGCNISLGTSGTVFIPTDKYVKTS
ncbi:MAG: xylulokinase, partial [Clostridia bacterium]|nr:xylulokinase [Clostridia bacterium]